MNIEPPGLMEWSLLLLVGALAGATNALRSFSTRGMRQAMIVGAVEGTTALFVTITVFLILYSVLPIMAGIVIPPLGLIGISGAVAHIGLRQTIKMILRIVESTVKK